MTTTNNPKERLTLFVTKETKKQAKKLALMADTTVSDLFERLINRTEENK